MDLKQFNWIKLGYHIICLDHIAEIFLMPGEKKLFIMMSNGTRQINLTGVEAVDAYWKLHDWLASSFAIRFEPREADGNSEQKDPDPKAN